MARPSLDRGGRRNQNNIHCGSKSVSLKGIVNVVIFSTFFLAVYSLWQIPGPDDDSKAPYSGYLSKHKSPIFNQAESKEDSSSSSSPIRLIMFLGIEGTGHHFWQDLIKESPILDQVEKYGLHPEFTRRLTRNLYRHKKNRWEGLWSAPCKWQDSDPTPNVTQIQDEVVATLRAMKDRILHQRMEDDSSMSSSSPVIFPVNFLSSDGNEFGVASYPSFLKPCRALQYPNLDIWYTACDVAGVRCEHVYIYRDPYAVTKSTVDNRPINKDKLEAIHLYTTQLQILYSQLLLFPNRLVGCWNYDGALLPTEWSTQINPILQFADATALGDVIQKVYHPKPALTEKDKRQIVPASFQVYMDSFSKVHAAVVQHCKAAN